jgi:hypothetical protein
MRNVFSEEEWLALVKEQKASGKSQVAWCEDNNIDFSAFRDTLNDLRKKDTRKPRDTRSTEERLALIKEQRESGKSQRKWCEEKGISYRTFTWYVRDLLSKGLIEQVDKSEPTTGEEKWMALKEVTRPKGFAWDVEEQKALVEKQIASGKSRREWCAEQGLDLNQFRNRAYAMQKKERMAGEPSDEACLALVNEQIASGKTQADWCAEKDVSLTAFSRMKHKLVEKGLLQEPERKLSHVAEKWLPLINEQRASGKTQSAWCKEKGINLGTFKACIVDLRRDGLLERSIPGIPKKTDDGANVPSDEPAKTNVLSNEEKLELVKEQIASGKLTNVWCKEKGINFWLYQKYLRDLVMAGVLDSSEAVGVTVIPKERKASISATEELGGLVEKQPAQKQHYGWLDRYSKDNAKRKTPPNLVDRLSLVREQEASGKSRRAWCEENGISFSTFRWYIADLRRKGWLPSTNNTHLDNAQEQSELTKEQIAGGKPLKEWCEENGIDFDTFCKRANNLRAESIIFDDSNEPVELTENDLGLLHVGIGPYDISVDTRYPITQLVDLCSMLAERTVN